MKRKPNVVGNSPSREGSPEPSPPSRSRSHTKCKKADTALSRQGLDETWQLLDSKIGGRDGLLGAALASSSPKASILAELLLDPAFKRSGTKDLAKKAGMSAPEIVDLFRDKKMMETILILHDSLPAVVKGAAEDAQPKFDPCPDCKGTKIGENGIDDCWACKGRGEIRKSGDKDKLAFIGNATKLTERGGLNVNVNTQINAQTINQSHSFEDMMRVAAIPAKQKAIEGEVIGTTED